LPDNRQCQLCGSNLLDSIKITDNFAGGVSKAINYGYDEMNRRTYLERDGNTTNATDGFEYDKNGQLIKFHLNGTLSGGVVANGTITSYTLDASGSGLHAQGQVDAGLDACCNEEAPWK
jgi:hypothetical protein